ncbi:MAG TPA: TerC family protein [Rhodanobacteraceae bacterium]|nr:TerC family protein [Rhodanobacteraceae bacterium]
MPSLEFFTDPELWIALLALSTLEIVLGVDNLVFISIAVGRLPEERRSRARRFGLALACLTRILLLVTLAELARMGDESGGLFEFFGQPISIRDLVLIGGGIFLLVKGAMEIIDAVGGGEVAIDATRAPARFGMVIAQIAIIDIVFSLDSVITAVGMVNNIPVMVAAIVLAVLVMIFVANPVGRFIDDHPTIRMLALAFIILIGVVLIGEGFQIDIPRGYVYFAMAFSVAIESLNLLARRHQRSHGEREPSKPE